MFFSFVFCPSLFLFHIGAIFEWKGLWGRPTVAFTDFFRRFLSQCNCCKNRPPGYTHIILCEPFALKCCIWSILKCDKMPGTAEAKREEDLFMEDLFKKKCKKNEDCDTNRWRACYTLWFLRRCRLALQVFIYLVFLNLRTRQQLGC